MKPADVQVEHGHVRIANRLAEALLDAPLSGTQFKIMHTLIRLTYGWRRKTVTLSHAELAKYCSANPSGAFRAALRDLIGNGAVLQLEQGTGRTKSTLAVQKDFTKWGLYQVGADRLAIVYGQRPESHDDLMFQADIFTDNEGAQNEAEGVPESGPGGGLEVGRVTPPNPSIGETYDSGKTVESQRAQTNNKEDDDVGARAALAANLDLSLFGGRRALLLEMIREARSPFAMACTLREYLDNGVTPSQLGVAVKEYRTNGEEKFNSAHFAGFVGRARASIDRQDGARALSNERDFQRREDADRETERRETAERDRMLAEFERDHPERYLDLRKKAETDTKITGIFRDGAVLGALTTLVRHELLEHKHRGAA